MWGLFSFLKWFPHPPSQLHLEVLCMLPGLLKRVPFRVLRSYLMRNANARAKILSSCPILIVLQTPKPAKNVIGSYKIALRVKFRRGGVQVRFSSHLAPIWLPKRTQNPLSRTGNATLEVLWSSNPFQVCEFDLQILLSGSPNDGGSS